MKNLEMPPKSHETVEQPLDIALMSAKALEKVSQAQKTFTNVAEAIAERGIANEERGVYDKVLQAMAELQEHKEILDGYKKEA
jgi:hypothetical protein